MRVLRRHVQQRDASQKTKDEFIDEVGERATLASKAREPLPAHPFPLKARNSLAELAGAKFTRAAKA